MSPFQRHQAKQVAQATIDLASRDLERGLVDDFGWTRLVADALAAAYLRDDDPRWQSGFDGDAELWREARELILDPVHHDGTFLDIGWATGHLMECLESWALERGRLLSISGLELNGDLADKARRRLPRLAKQVFDGNVMDWSPPQRFDFVHSGLEYVPPSRRSWLVRRLLDHFVAPGGRLIAGPVGHEALGTIIKTFESVGATPTTTERTDRNGTTRYVVWCTV